MSLPVLPEDIEIYIWEIFADLYPREVPDCCQVLDQIKAWLQPMLYRVIVAHPEGRWPNVNIVLSPSDDLITYPNYVHHVLVGGSLDENPDLAQCLDLLPLLPNVKDLAIWLTGYDPTPVLLPLCAHLRPQRLSISFAPLLGHGRGLRGHARHSIFSRLTHLEVIHDCNNWEGGKTWQNSLA
ncbi:hypothetical protein BDN72DRAFT_126611 [Pluteus cervinus]|uniref:Uncharacterized protein n=1 Tax=Pluteus cervinus TaxID=181527 RepID=A0ACD3AMX2_9AGAR|nr:hypothetical protein BDN72DRAFT_126611 [Pluteus cervinus]